MFNRKSTPSLTYLSATTEIQGTLNVEGNLRVDGIVHGTVHVRGDLEISKTGLVEGPEVRGRDIVVHGVIKAQIFAEGRLILTRTARLEGDITARSIDIEAGATYVGHIVTQNQTSMPSLPEAVSYPKLVGQELAGQED
jgi:cytoskeletal protein CcmA (bactofilin family)